VVPRTATWSVSNPSRGAMLSTGLLTPLEPGPITVQATIDGDVWEVTLDAYDWVRLVGSTSVFHYIPADNLITNKFGNSEYPRLVFACINSGQFFAWVWIRSLHHGQRQRGDSFDGNPRSRRQCGRRSARSTRSSGPAPRQSKKAFAQQDGELRRSRVRLRRVPIREAEGHALSRDRVSHLRLTELLRAVRLGQCRLRTPATVQSAATAFAEAQSAIAAFHSSDGRLEALRESRQQQGASATGAPTAELRRAMSSSTTETPARKR
jgi:hypothetical protein